MDIKELQELSGRKFPPQLTRPAVQLITESLRLGEFMEYALSLGQFAIENYDLYRANYLDKEKTSPIHRHLLQTQGEDAINKNVMFSHHAEIACEMVIQRTADNFVKYLSDLLALLFTAHPQSLRSGEQETLDFILSFSNIEELISALAEKRVEKLAYLGMRDLADYFSRKLGFELFPSPEHKRETELLIELRNIIVHNRGRVSKIFKQRVADYPRAIGERADLDFSKTMRTRVLVENLALDIDHRAIAKWGLPTARHKIQ